MPEYRFLEVCTYIDSNLEDIELISPGIRVLASL